MICDVPLEPVYDNPDGSLVSMLVYQRVHRLLIRTMGEKWADCKSTPHSSPPSHPFTLTHTIQQLVPKYNYREKRADWQAHLDKAQPRQHWGAPAGNAGGAIGLS